MASSDKGHFPPPGLLVLLPSVTNRTKSISKTNERCLAHPCPLAKEQAPALFTLLLGITTTGCWCWQQSQCRSTRWEGTLPLPFLHPTEQLISPGQRKARSHCPSSLPALPRGSELRIHSLGSAWQTARSVSPGAWVGGSFVLLQGLGTSLAVFFNVCQ